MIIQSTFSIIANNKISMTEMIILFFTVAAKVPPLDVIVAIGSPRVTASSVEVEFVTTRPVIGARCFLRYENRNDYKDCQSKLYFFQLLLHF